MLVYFLRNFVKYVLNQNWILGSLKVRYLCIDM